VTILFYLSDVPLGGETLFPRASQWWDDSTQSIVSGGTLRSILSSSLFLPPSLHLMQAIFSQTGMPLASLCNPTSPHARKHFQFAPKRLHALLFYSQTPTRELDLLSLHASCPVVQVREPLAHPSLLILPQGIKWIATVWMWNGPMSTPSAHQSASPKIAPALKSAVVEDTIVVMFSLSRDLLEVTAPIRLLDPLQQVAPPLLPLLTDTAAPAPAPP
jgi:hypothetical protein